MTFQLDAFPSELPKSKPNLMPFHISYTGPTPVSTYFRVKEVTRRRVGCPVQTDADDVTMAEASSSSQPFVHTSKLSQWLFDLNNTAKRYVSAFRGRVVQGFEMSCPEGYTGVVLGVQSSSTSSTSATTKKLTPISTFPTFIIWSPDIPVNEGRDEYVRGITEWSFLADQLHRVENDEGTGTGTGMDV